MTKETINLIKLIASEGNILTNGTLYAKEAYLGSGDSEENWYEITEEEYNEIIAEMEENLEYI